MQNKNTNIIFKINEVRKLLDDLNKSKDKVCDFDLVIEKFDILSKSLEEESSNEEFSIKIKKSDEKIYSDILRVKEIKLKNEKIIEQANEILTKKNKILDLKSELLNKNKKIEDLTDGLDKMRKLLDFDAKTISNDQKEVENVEILTLKKIIEKKDREIKKLKDVLKKEIENFDNLKDTKKIKNERSEEAEKDSKTIKDLTEKIETLKKSFDQQKNDNFKEILLIKKERDFFEKEYEKGKSKLNNTKVLLNEKENRVIALQTHIKDKNDELSIIQKQEKILKLKILDLQGNIRVFMRIRKEFEGEKTKNFHIKNDKLTLENKNFYFDEIFDENVDQRSIYDNLELLIKSIFSGFNVMISCYGQTGSGKTYTMEGVSLNNKDDLGIFPRAVNTIYKEIEDLKGKGFKISLKLSLVEIYNDSIKYFTESNDKNYIKIDSKDEIFDLYFKCLKERKTAETKMNIKSSRSHFLIFLKLFIFNDHEKREGEILFIDLAGSERVSRSKVTGERLKEAQHINTSLLGLMNVISALKDKTERNIENLHIPFRNCKLTFILKPLIEKKIRIILFLNVSFLKLNIPETICTLRFGQISRDVKFGKIEKNIEKF